MVAEMDVRVPVVTVDLASGPRDISSLGSCRKAHVLFMYRDQPICRREVDVIHGKITGVELALAMNGPGRDGARVGQMGGSCLCISISVGLRMTVPQLFRLVPFLSAREIGPRISIGACVPSRLDQQRC